MTLFKMGPHGFDKRIEQINCLDTLSLATFLPVDRLNFIALACVNGIGVMGCVL